MKFSTAFSIAGTFIAVSAQNFGAEPACAVSCLQSAISVAGCGANDQACQCGTAQAAIQTAVTPCLISACNVDELASAASVGFALCSSFSASATAVTGSVTTQAITSENPGGLASSTTADASATGSALSSSNPGGVMVGGLMGVVLGVVAVL
ncbi:hypothetical protein BTUL_0001g02030 [Botrytis tulipae]|uniref:CFEM domain-containing protein n=1 Tax=Botrytis tulipae TaxID=87230 RepID=A0A4Z1FFI7_9HELO|nr:hypothetical protein BTUL_0001g02030 [Botrytis tulipae]